RGRAARPPRPRRSVTPRAGSSPARARSRQRPWSRGGHSRGSPWAREPYSSPMGVLTPRSLAQAAALQARPPGSLPIPGGIDVMVAFNFDRARPEVVLNLNEVAELRGWSREDGELRLAAGLTYTEAMEGELASLLPALAEASRTVGSPQIRNRGTIGGNLGTASPAGDALPPLLVEDAEVECVSV